MPLPPHHLLLHQNPEWLTFLVPAYPGCPAKTPLNKVVAVVVLALRAGVKRAMLLPLQ